MSADAAATPAPTKPPTPRRRGRWRRRLFWSFGILFLIVLLAPLLVGLSPVRNKIAASVGEALGRKVEIGSISAFWFKGVDVRDVTIHSPEGFDGPLAKIHKVHADLDVLGLVSGKIAARLRVVQPHVTLRRNAAGTSNAKDLGSQPSTSGRTPPASDSTSSSAADMDLNIVLVGGTVEALDADGKAANALRDIQFTASVKPNGTKNLDMEALAEGAGKGGGDARIKLLLTMDANETGIFKVTVPPLKLSRLARMAEDTLDVADLTGTVEMNGRGTLHPNRTISGELTTLVDALGATGADGTHFTVRRIESKVQLRAVNDDTEANITAEVGDLRLRRVVDGREEIVREPAMALNTSVRFNPDGDRIRIGSGTLQGGNIMTIAVKEAVRIEPGAGGRFMGSIEARIDLGRLGSFRGLVPALEPLAGGSLTATVTGSGSDRKDVGAGILIENLKLRPSEIAPAGYEEPRLVAAFRMEELEDGAVTLRLTMLDSSLARLTSSDPSKGVRFTYGPGSAYAVDGDFNLRVQLGSLSRLLAESLGLEPGERIGGTLHFDSTGKGTTDDMRFTTKVRARDITFPRSWSPVATPASFDALLVSTRKAGASQVTLSDLRGMGLRGSGSASFNDVRVEDGPAAGTMTTAFRQGEMQLTVDLTQARPWLGGLMDMDPRGMLGGRVRADLRIRGDGDGHHMVGTTQANDLYVLARPGAVPIQEKRVTLRSDVHIAGPGGKHEARDLTLDAAGLRLELSGSSFVAEPDADADVHVKVGGDAAVLAPTLAALLGEGYEDLKGSGQIAGSVTVTGSPADHGTALFTTADLVFGTWSTSGLDIKNARLKASRADASSPLSARFDAGINGGTAEIDIHTTLGQPAIAWTSDVKLAGVDTSTLVVGDGVGGYLAYVLPAILPADAKMPVLSGRLDADLHGASSALQGDAMANDLTGSGTIKMEQGEVKQSTLFGGGKGGDSKLGKLVTALKFVAPEASLVLTELAKAVGFSTLLSEFTVANRVVDVKQTKLTGPRVIIDMTGKVGFNRALDLRSKVALQGSAGKRLEDKLPGGAIPMTIAGTLDDPKVSPTVDPSAFVPIPGKGNGKSLLDKIKKKLPKLPTPKLPKLPKLPKPKLPKLPNPFK